MTFLPTLDPGEALSRLPTKTSVTRLKQERAAQEALFAGAEELAREEARFLEDEMVRPFFARQGRLSERKPAWLEDGKAASPRLTADRRGTLTHALLAHVDLAGPLDAPGLRAQAEHLIKEGLIGGPFEEPELILKSLDFEALAWFFESQPGRWMRECPGGVSRELAFTARKALIDFDPEAARLFPAENILVQGVIDAVIDLGDQVVILDYKTDRVRGPGGLAELVSRYAFQIEQYTRALESIWKIRDVKAGLVFLDAREIKWVDAEGS